MNLNEEVNKAHNIDSDQNITSIRSSSIITFSAEGIKTLTRAQGEELASYGHDGYKRVPSHGGPMTRNLVEV